MVRSSPDSLPIILLLVLSNISLLFWKPGGENLLSLSLMGFVEVRAKAD
jgi:hypothetical protein